MEIIICNNPHGHYKEDLRDRETDPDREGEGEGEKEKKIVLFSFIHRL